MTFPDELREASKETNITRREILRRAGLLGTGAVVGEAMAAWQAGPSWARLIEKAVAVPASGSSFQDVEHFVFLMMENRSYDHYFGAYHKGRGFNDHPKKSLGAFAQPYPGGGNVVPKHTLLPFHLDSNAGFECTDDLTHDWGPMHDCWNDGKMDSWVKVHTLKEGERGTTTMGYYTGADIPFYWALADHFTLLDGYHSSIMGPTHPNRLMQLSGTIDPEGKLGGPVVQTLTVSESGAVNQPADWNLAWETMPEVLQNAGVSWKVYNPSNGDVANIPQYAAMNLGQYFTWDPGTYTPENSDVLPMTDNVLPYFPTFRDQNSPLYELAFNQTFPGQFYTDVQNDQLPSVSWVIPPLGFDEHPAASSRNGEWFTSLVLDALVSNPEVWSKTALFLMYDENDGWFDHVAPPTAPKGTAGEYLTAPLPSIYTANDVFTDINGLNGKEIKGPLGLGMRVPALMISPFSKGGHVVSNVYDHTSQLQLLEKRFGVHIPNISKWRRKTVGDLSQTLMRKAPDASVPSLPKTAVLMPQGGSCMVSNQITDADSGAAVGKFPRKQKMPKQGGGFEPVSKFVKLTEQEHAISDDEHVEIHGEGTATTKSAYNKLFAETVRSAPAKD
jgi:phospholipase C